MNTIQDLVDLIRISPKGVVAKCLAGITGKEPCAVEGMLARLTCPRVIGGHHNLVELLFDFEEFEAHNKRLEATASNPAIWSGRPAETEVYFEANEELCGLLEIQPVDSAPLRLEYLGDSIASAGRVDYIEWLESQLTRLRAGAQALLTLVDVHQLQEVVSSAARAHSGMAALPEVSADSPAPAGRAADAAVRLGLLEVVGNGVVKITEAGKTIALAWADAAAAGKGRR